MYSTKKRIFYLLGGISLGLGLLGMLLPILPTTPFLILSGYFFSKSSKKIHSWILSRPYYGKIIKDWEESGIISKQAKIQAISALIMLFSISIIFLKLSPYLGLIGLGIGYFIITRPSKNPIS
jgi:uncharacterized membrane protein YbaN (DUF454 family)